MAKIKVAPYETRTICLRIVPKVGLNVQLTQYPRDLTMSNGQVYLSAAGYDFTGYVAGNSTAPAMIDLEGIVGQAGIGVDQINSGQFDNARCYLFAIDYTNPIEDFEEIVCSILGRTHIMDQRYKIEEMSLVDALNQSSGQTFMAMCQKTFGSQTFAGCKINLASYTFTGALNTVTDSHIFTCNSLTQATDYFASGTIQFITGTNAGLKSQEIKSFTSGGNIEVYESFYYTPNVGDTFTIIAGCRKRMSDCQAKGNIVNFGGFPYVPTTTQYMSVGGR